MYGSVDYDSDSVRNAYHHSSWYNVEFGIDCFLWSYDGGYNAGCVEITDSDHAWSVVLVIVMTRIDNDDVFVSYDDVKMSLVFRCTGPPSGTSRCCLSVVTVLSSSHRPWELPASLRPFPLLIRESIFLPLCCPFPERDAKKCAFPRQHAFHHGPVEKQTTATAAGGGAAVASLQHTAGSSRPQQPTAPHRCHYCQVSWNTNIKIVILSRKLPWLHAQECTDWVTYSGHFQWRALEESAMGEGGPENFPDFGFF